MQTGERSALLRQDASFNFTPAVHNVSGLRLGSGTVSVCYVCHGDVIQ